MQAICDALVGRPMKRYFGNTCLRKRRSVQNEARRRNLVNIDYSIRSGFPFLRRWLMGMLTLFESRQLAVRGPDCDTLRQPSPGPSVGALNPTFATRL